MSSLGSLFIVLAALLWSSDSLFRKPLTQNLSSWAIVFIEHLLALVFVVPILIHFWDKVKLITIRQWWAVIYIGIAASALATVAFTASFSYMSPSVSILLQKIQPLVTFLLAFIVLRERLPQRFWLWASLALVGAYLVSFPEIVPQFAFYQKGIIGVILALTAAILWGGATVFGRYLLNDIPHILVTALRFIVALPFLALLLGLNGGFSSFALSGRDLIFLIIIMLGPGFGAMYFYYRGLKVTQASISAILELTWPFLAVILNWIFLHETLGIVQIIGGLVLIGSIARLTIWSTQSKILNPKS
jgi:drug/metabolite transporter (DMT)-like permease